MNKHVLKISKMINGGYGLGQLVDGRLAMVRQVLPAEEVAVAIEEERKSHVFARPITITTASEFRVTPPCPWYGRCGGCDLQHGSYPGQLQVKRDILLDLIERQDGLKLPEGLPTVEPTLPSPLTSGYRQRIRLQVKDGRQLGYRQFRSHDIVAVSSCLIAGPEINRVLAAINSSQTATKLLTITSEIELLLNPATRRITSLCHLLRKPRPADFTCAQELQHEIELLERLFFIGQQFPLTPAAPADCTNQLAMTCAPPQSSLAPWTMHWEVGGFCQVNLAQNLNLIDLVLEYAAVEPNHTVLDLFCGAGNFSLPLAAKAESLLGIEGQGSAIRSAKYNSTEAGLTNTTFRKQPIHPACQELVAAGRSFDCLVLDPPRQGAPDLAALLAALCRSRLVYISCDPATLCRDLAELVHHSFKITRIQPVDMFPQTHHIETVVLLEKH